LFVGQFVAVTLCCLFTYGVKNWLLVIFSEVRYMLSPIRLSVVCL